MNQLINIQDMTIEQIREIEMQIIKKKTDLLEIDLQQLANEHKKLKIHSQQQELVVGEVSEKADYLKENMIIHSEQAQRLGNEGKKKIIECLGGKDAPAYKELYSKLTINFWGYFKQVFKIAKEEGKGKYRDLRLDDYESAMLWIRSYKPTKSMKSEIDLLNNVDVPLEIFSDFDKEIIKSLGLMKDGDELEVSCDGKQVVIAKKE